MQMRPPVRKAFSIFSPRLWVGVICFTYFSYLLLLFFRSHRHSPFCFSLVCEKRAENILLILTFWGILFIMVLLLTKSGKPSVEIVDQGACGFSKGNTEDYNGESFLETDPSGEDWKNICHFCQGHDPSAQENSGKNPVQHEKRRSERKFPLKR